MSDNHALKHQEDDFTKMIEDETAKLPSSLFLALALGSVVVSLGLQIAGAKPKSLFVGQWIAPFLLLGIYNKLVKLEGHDQVDNEGKGGF